MVDKILIVDDVAANRIVLKARLMAAWYQPLLAGDGLTCHQLAHDERPGVILLNYRLADMDGLAALKMLRADPVTRDIPVVFFGPPADLALRLAALEAGADDFIESPYDIEMLMARLRNYARNGQESTGGVLAEEAELFQTLGRIALVTVTPVRGEIWGDILSTAFPGMSRRLTVAEVMEQDVEQSDVILLEADCSRPDGGLQLLAELRSRPATRHAAICVICTGSSSAGAAMAYDLGANQVIPAHVEPSELTLRLAKLLRRKQHADRMRASVQEGLKAAVTDELTGLWNRRYALTQLPGIVERSHAAGLPYTVMVIDLDRFKCVNDRFGHAAGDKVLIQVAHRLAANLREGDLFARIGGEEFLVGLPDTSLEIGQRIAERLCSVIEAKPCRLPDGSDLTVTVSIGLASGLPERAGAEVPSDVIERADQALLSSKGSGRNKVTVSRNAA